MYSTSPGSRPRQPRPWASIMASMSVAVINWPGCIGAPPPRWLLASSSTALVTIGGTLSMPSLASGASGAGLTSPWVNPP
jgi:hypothetical protein